jgi:hypothetical protein
MYLHSHVHTYICTYLCNVTIDADDLFENDEFTVTNVHINFVCKVNPRYISSLELASPKIELDGTGLILRPRASTFIETSSRTFYLPTFYVCTYILCMYLHSMYVPTFYVCTYILCMYLHSMYVPMSPPASWDRLNEYPFRPLSFTKICYP